ncbi:hypothetical protein M885DRAFT_502335 [Pelagophyceae sp. CCMP2097]|nr:hypothetical protein M885DRAFT_502335 [Pelagophyceae sp. CCMP2097]
MGNSLWRPDGNSVRRFPFDAQELSVEVAFNETAMPSSASFGRCMVPESQFDKNISQRSGALWRYGIEYNDLEEYDMYEPFVTAFGGALAPHTFVVSVPIVCLPTFFITFSAFAIQATKGDSGRMQLTSAYMLAVVAFKFSIQGTLPKTAYLTQIDLYLNAAMYLNVVISAA